MCYTAEGTKIAHAMERHGRISNMICCTVREEEKELLETYLKTTIRNTEVSVQPPSIFP
jgi:hypothetical protein